MRCADSKQLYRWLHAAGAVFALIAIFVESHAGGAQAIEREVSVGIEGTVERILNEPDYTPLPVNENASIILRVHLMEPTPEGQYKYNFAYIGLQDGVYNLADYLQNAEGRRVRDRLPAISVTVRSLLPENASTTLPEMPAGLPAHRIPYRPTMAVLILAWIGCGAALFRRPRPNTVTPPPPTAPPPTQSLGAILEPLAMKAARKTITTEEKILLERTIIRFWSEKLEISDLDAEERRDAILEDEEGGALLRSVERWLYQPFSHVLSSEISKVLAPYFEIPAPIESANNSHDSDSDLEESLSDDEQDEEYEGDDEDHKAYPGTDTKDEESELEEPAKDKHLSQSKRDASEQRRVRGISETRSKEKP
jgi:hypothetical protein